MNVFAPGRPPYRIEPGGLPPAATRQLYEAWVQALAAEQLGLSQHGPAQGPTGRAVSFGDPGREHFTLGGELLSVSLDAVVGVDENAVRGLLQEAAQRVRLNDHGEGVVYASDLIVSGAAGFLLDATHFSRIFVGQVHVEGARRLSDVVLLDFQQASTAGVALDESPFAPESAVRATIFVPGPCHGEYTGRIAAGLAEVVAAVCSFATGRPVRHTVPLFPVSVEEAVAARSRRYDPTIPTLARDSISLDLFGDLRSLSDIDGLTRARGALLAYHAAISQPNADVAVMLLVTCLEALVSPRQPWGKERVTSRFVKAVAELCPQALDSVLTRRDVEAAFSFRRRGGPGRQRRDLLYAIYDHRSHPTHSGLGLSPVVLDFGNLQGVRVAVLSQLAQAAVVAYVSAPRSSTIGHPALHPDTGPSCTPSPQSGGRG